MAQRISRAKRTVSGVRFDQPGDVATVLRVLYLVFNEGYSGDVDLAAEAIRLTRQLATAIDHPEVAGLLALMLLTHARRAARTASDGSLVPLAEQDRGRWDTASIAEGVEILQAALARDRLGEFQAQAAIAALHADAQTAGETDWVQVVEWYDELARLTDNPVVRLNRAVAVGEADGPRAGLAALAPLDESLPRHAAVAAYLHERDGDLATAARLYAEAAGKASNLAERDHLTRQAARLNARTRDPVRLAGDHPCRTSAPRPCPCRRHRRRRDRLLRRLPPRPRRLDRRAPARARPPHLRHHLARRRPDDLLRVDVGDLDRDPAVLPRALRTARGGDRPGHRLQAGRAHRGGGGRGPPGGVPPGRRVPAAPRARGRGDLAAGDGRPVPLGEDRRPARRLPRPRRRPGQPRRRHHRAGQGRPPARRTDRRGRLGRGRAHRPRARRPASGSPRVRPARRPRSRPSTSSTAPACGPASWGRGTAW